MCYGSILSESVQRARKAYRCDLCRKPIVEGRSYYKETNVQDGSIESLRMHRYCAASLRAEKSVAYLLDGECIYLDRSVVSDYVKEEGWKSWLARVRKFLPHRTQPAASVGDNNERKL